MNNWIFQAKSIDKQGERKNLFARFDKEPTLDIVWGLVAKAFNEDVADEISVDVILKGYVPLPNAFVRLQHYEG